MKTTYRNGLNVATDTTIFPAEKRQKHSSY